MPSRYANDGRNYFSLLSVISSFILETAVESKNQAVVLLPRSRSDL